VAKRGPKSHRVRDLWIYLLVTELRNKKGVKKVSKLRAITDAVPLLEKWGINLSIPGLWSAYEKGEQFRHGQDKDLVWKLPTADEKLPARMGRPMDAVRNYIIYDAVCDALKTMQNPSLRKAYALARQYLRIEWPNDPVLGVGKGASVGAIRAAYEKMRLNLE
jgi:hypothetical protein